MSFSNFSNESEQPPRVSLLATGVLWFFEPDTNEVRSSLFASSPSHTPSRPRPLCSRTAQHLNECVVPTSRRVSLTDRPVYTPSLDDSWTRLRRRRVPYPHPRGSSSDRLRPCCNPGGTSTSPPSFRPSGDGSGRLQMGRKRCCTGRHGFRGGHQVESTCEHT